MLIKDRNAQASYDYAEAVSRNIGWLTQWEQLQLREKRVAIAGVGGVGGFHAVSLARLGVGAFHLSDMDSFEVGNFNRQVGATMASLGRPKVETVAEMVSEINPTLDIKQFPSGINADNVDEFLSGVDIYVDGLDFFAVEIRSLVFARCAELRIPIITAGPLGFSTAYLIYMPGGMTFADYFRMDGLPPEKAYANFVMGVAPAGTHMSHLMDPTRLDLAGKAGPSTITGVTLATGVVCAEVTKILLGRGPVYALPWYHQYDAYSARYIRKKLRGGNNNPLQKLKLKLAYRKFSNLSDDAWPRDETSGGTEIEQILEAARWAPSGDNTQPWRFRIIDNVTVVIELRDQSGEDIYDFDGKPTLLSSGMLLETMRIAASKFARTLTWDYRKVGEGRHKITVSLQKMQSLKTDPLEPYIAIRSVDRNPYKPKPLSGKEKGILEETLGDALQLEWFETPQERAQQARINGIATDIRLRIPEAFTVHKKMLDWTRRFSPTGIPAEATGLSAPLLAVMRWGMKSWQRSKMLTAGPWGTLLAKRSMDLIPGRACAAHFNVAFKQAPSAGREAEAWITAGQSWQRFWLTATRLGLVSQPQIAVLAFAYWANQGVTFTAGRIHRARAETLARRLRETSSLEADNIVFRGRIGTPITRQVKPRSIRKPLSALLIEKET